MRRTVLAAAGRLAVAAGLCTLLSIVVFAGVDALPGDPVTARLGGTATPEQIATARERLGLDQPLPRRYTDWVAGLVRGDLGTSASGRPVTDMLGERLGNSLLLAALTVVLLVPLSLAAGVAAGLRPGSRTDRGLSSGALLLVAVPEFLLAAVLLLVFAAGLGWLPPVSLVPAGQNPLSVPGVLVLPVLSLLLPSLAYATRLIRAATAAAVRAPHVEFLRLNGVAAGRVLRHAVLPAVLPVGLQVWLVTAVGLVGGAVLVEQVYGYPGVGGLLVQAVRAGDLPVVQAVATLLGAAMLAALLLADLGVRLLTPTLRTP
ncbi:ABC transporter permease [Actinomycetes bacterium KLBMP 9797]